MKRSIPWSDEDESSTSDSDSETEKVMTKKATGKGKGPTSGAVSFEALKQHGYKGGLSVLGVPPPEEKPNWSWSSGKEKREAGEAEESYEERQKTRAAVLDAEELVHVQSRTDKKNISFSQKEKRKRELGQASRGKNYVEEEKRLLRSSGVFSGFDT